MVFSTPLFLFVYLSLTLLLYYAVPLKGRNLALLAVSLFFYAWGERIYVVIMVASTLIDYTHGMLVERCKARGNDRGARWAVASSVFFNLALLGFFKYWDFLAASFQAVGLNFMPVLNVHLPIGISFYTFQTMSYTIDVYRGDARAQRSLVNFGTFVTLFPQLIAGPIIKYKDLGDQIDSRTCTVEKFASGVQMFVIGLGKKVLIANNVGMLWESYKAMAPGDLTVAGAWLGVLAFAIQIYFDFSGYSDMAVGLGRMLGFEFMRNFNYPYISRSITEFWRRWHISLSTWFRDYVYIPLGGSRCSLAKNCRNLLIVFLLTGLWHGAAWQYVAFGLLHGVLLCLERLGLRKFLQRIPSFFAHAYTLVVLWFTLIIFGAHGLAEGLAAWKGILSWQSGAQGYTAAAFADTKLMVLLAASLLLCGPLQACFPRLKKALYAKEAPGLPGMVGLLVLLFLSLMRVTAGTYSAFIYFQF